MPPLGRFPLVVNALALLALGATPATASPSASLTAGYAFRSAGDSRAHGAAAALALDVPLGEVLALRPEGVVAGFGGSAQAPASLGLFAGALSLVYRFDDTDAEALAAVGPLAGAVADGADVGLRAGALASLGLRFPLFPAVAVEARVSLPLVLWGPAGFALPGAAAFPDGSPNALPLQTCFTVGLSVDPVALVADPDSER